MYEKGLGVPKNEESAAYFKSRLAELRKEQPAGHSNDKLLDILNNASQVRFSFCCYSLAENN
jgi:TPR repeat protein